MTKSISLFEKPRNGCNNATEQINVTTSAIVALPACLATAAFKNARSLPEQKQRIGGRREMSLYKLVPTPEQQKQFRMAFCDVVRSLLFGDPHGLTGKTDRVERIKKKVAAKKLTI